MTKKKKPLPVLFSAERLRTIRMSFELPVPEMAKVLKLSAVTYYRLESGASRIRGPLIPLLAAIEKLPIRLEELKGLR